MEVRKCRSERPAEFERPSGEGEDEDLMRVSEET